jgi:hypothetical protein
MDITKHEERRNLTAFIVALVIALAVGVGLNSARTNYPHLSAPYELEGR